MTQATDFSKHMYDIWNGVEGEPNAALEAERMFAARKVGPVTIGAFITTPGDIPASIYQFTDHSLAIVYDDGSGIVPAEVDIDVENAEGVAA